MFLADCHTHSLCSPDSNAPMLQMAQKAYEYGLHTLCLTDHCDLLSLEGERTLDYDWTPVHLSLIHIFQIIDPGTIWGDQGGPPD